MFRIALILLAIVVAIAAFFTYRQQVAMEESADAMRRAEARQAEVIASRLPARVSPRLPVALAPTNSSSLQSPATNPSRPAIVDRPAVTGFQCDGRTHCSQMHSCEEARFFLSRCPGVKMDGNHDGEPCEQQFPECGS